MVPRSQLNAGAASAGHYATSVGHPAPLYRYLRCRSRTLGPCFHVRQPAAREGSSSCSCSSSLADDRFLSTELEQGLVIRAKRRELLQVAADSGPCVMVVKRAARQDDKEPQVDVASSSVTLSQTPSSSRADPQGWEGRESPASATAQLEQQSYEGSSSTAKRQRTAAQSAASGVTHGHGSNGNTISSNSGAVHQRNKVTVTCTICAQSSTSVATSPSHFVDTSEPGQYSPTSTSHENHRLQEWDSSMYDSGNPWHQPRTSLSSPVDSAVPVGLHRNSSSYDMYRGGRPGVHSQSGRQPAVALASTSVQTLVHPGAVTTAGLSDVDAAQRLTSTSVSTLTADREGADWASSERHALTADREVAGWVGAEHHGLHYCDAQVSVAARVSAADAGVYLSAGEDDNYTYARGQQVAVGADIGTGYSSRGQYPSPIIRTSSPFEQTTGSEQPYGSEQPHTSEQPHASKQPYSYDDTLPSSSNQRERFASDSSEELSIAHATRNGHFGNGKRLGGVRNGFSNGRSQSNLEDGSVHTSPAAHTAFWDGSSTGLGTSRSPTAAALHPPESDYERATSCEGCSSSTRVLPAHRRESDYERVNSNTGCSSSTSVPPVHPHVVRVSRNTRAGSLGGCVAKLIRSKGCADVLVMGRPALKVAMYGLAIARSMLKQDGNGRDCQVQCSWLQVRGNQLSKRRLVLHVTASSADTSPDTSAADEDDYEHDTPVMSEPFGPDNSASTNRMARSLVKTVLRRQKVTYQAWSYDGLYKVLVTLAAAHSVVHQHSQGGYALYGYPELQSRTVGSEQRTFFHLIVQLGQPDDATQPLQPPFNGSVPEDGRSISQPHKLVNSTSNVDVSQVSGSAVSGVRREQFSGRERTDGRSVRGVQRRQAGEGERMSGSSVSGLRREWSSGRESMEGIAENQPVHKLLLRQSSMLGGRGQGLHTYRSRQMRSYDMYSSEDRFGYIVDEWDGGEVAERAEREQLYHEVSYELGYDSSYHGTSEYEQHRRGLHRSSWRDDTPRQGRRSSGSTQAVENFALEENMGQENGVGFGTSAQRSAPDLINGCSEDSYDDATRVGWRERESERARYGQSEDYCTDDRDSFANGVESARLDDTMHVGSRMNKGERRSLLAYPGVGPHIRGGNNGIHAHSSMLNRRLKDEFIQSHPLSDMDCELGGHGKEAPQTPQHDNVRRAHYREVDRGVSQRHMHNRADNDTYTNHNFPASAEYDGRQEGTTIASYVALQESRQHRTPALPPSKHVSADFFSFDVKLEQLMKVGEVLDTFDECEREQGTTARSRKGKTPAVVVAHGDE